jgi:hypothetical protein
MPNEGYEYPVIAGIALETFVWRVEVTSQIG